VLIIDRVWLSIVAFAKRMIVAFAKRMADAVWFRHQRATSTRGTDTDLRLDTESESPRQNDTE
jgi:hypothetical protein